MKHYTPREEPHSDTMQRQVHELGWTLKQSDTPGKAAVFNRNGELKGVFSPDEWFEYIERRWNEHTRGEGAER